MILMLLLLLLRAGPGDQPNFVAIDVYVDTGGRPLAAYQVDIDGESGGSLLVGVEGGDTGAYAAAPYYDPAALQRGRIVLAAFSTEKRPPSGRVRIARLHFQESGIADYSAELIIAASPGANLIDARIELVRVGEEK